MSNAGLKHRNDYEQTKLVALSAPNLIRNLTTSQRIIRANEAISQLAARFASQQRGPASFGPRVRPASHSPALGYDNRMTCSPAGW